VDVSSEHDNGPSGSIKCCEILEYLNTWRLRKKGFSNIKAGGKVTRSNRCVACRVAHHRPVAIISNTFETYRSGS
jgi:hypothetical protein